MLMIQVAKLHAWETAYAYFRQVAKRRITSVAHLATNAEILNGA